MLTQYRFTLSGLSEIPRFWTRIFLGSLAVLLILPTFSQAQSPLTIQSSTGRVGVGTTAPAYTLDVNGTVNATAFRGDGSQLTGLPGGSGGSQWSNNGSSIYYNGGNVGVGNSTIRSLFQLGTSTALTGSAQSTTDNLSPVFLSFQAADGEAKAATFLNSLTASSGSINESTSIVLTWMQDNGNLAYGTKILAGKEGDYTTGSTASSFLSFYTTNANTFAEKLRITTSGNVGIGTSSPTSKLHVIGDITATGAKNFQIDHPLEPEKKLLVHSALEGPEVAVYYRGEAQLVNGEMEITLPFYFEALTRKERRTVQLTPIKGWSPLYIADEIQDGRFKVRTTEGSNPAQPFYWEVKAVRADVAPLVVEKLKDAEPMKVAENAK